jgi:hypothetical protein
MFRDERALAVYNHPLLWQIRDLLLRLKLNTIPTLLFALLSGLLFYFYFKNKNEINKKKIIFFACLFQIIVFFSYPILSTDIFSYVLSDRIDVVYHQNVWKVSPDNFKHDPFYNLSDWTDKTRIYGGVNQAIYSPVTAISGDTILTNIAAHKMVVIAFAAATVFLMPSAIVFFNPLFILETAGSGHNDVIMLFFVILALLITNPLLSGVLLGLATQVKTVPALLSIFLLLKLISELRIKKAFMFLISYLSTILIIYYLMGINPLDTIARTAGSVNVYWQSLPMLIRSPILNLGLISLLGIQVYRSLIFRLNAVEVFIQTMLIYLLFFLPAFWNWYPIWLLTLLPFVSKNSKIKPYVLAFTASSILAYATYWLALRFNYHFFLWPVIMYLTILAGPAAVFIYEKIHRH